MVNRVLPWYGNTHSVASGTARQTTHYREEARHIIRNYFNLSDANSVIFAGAGVTAAVVKFLNLLEEGLREGSLACHRSGDMRSFLLEDRWGSLMCSACNVRVKNEAQYRSHCHTALHAAKVSSVIDNSPVDKVTKLHFLIDSHSHHSSLLPFREAARRNPDAISIQSVDLHDIESSLGDLPPNTLPIAVLCAMSNITGEGPSDSEIFKINELVHAAKGIVAWDLATYASHHRFDMNPVHSPMGYSDFAFVSPHKLLGGPGASGLLLARREWMKNEIPTVPGGGVVFFASEKEESYIQNSEEREEAGTPDILGCIRAGLVFSFHSKLDMKKIAEREVQLAGKFRNQLEGISSIKILGNHVPTPLISFNIAFSNDRLFHHNFVVAVLNDLFGIQVRGGCACAGPYAQHLLGLSEKRTHEFHVCLQQSGQEIFRPGFVRLGIHWTMTETEVEVMADAVRWIAENGQKLLSVYTVDLETGEWKHRHSNHAEERDWISEFDLFGRSIATEEIGGEIVQINDLIKKADEALIRIHESIPLESVKDAKLDERNRGLVWFAMPSDARDLIKQGLTKSEFGPKLKDPESAKISRESTQDSAQPQTKKAKKLQAPKKLRTLVTSAIKDFSMIKEGDRVLIGISGGKDSLSLLHLLLECQRKCPFRFEIACATVDPMIPEYQPHALIPYMESIGVKYHFLSAPIVELAKTAMTGKQSICAFCSRMKRGMLYGCMRENGYNVLALGQHLDDLAESFLMSCFRNGCLSTMKANYTIKEKDLRVIRPLIYVREKMTDDFAREAQLPIIRDNCPACFSAPKERHRIKMLLSNEEYQNQFLFFSMLQAMRPLMSISPAMSTRELIEQRLFPIRNADEDNDQAAEELLLPCSDGNCPLPPRS